MASQTLRPSPVPLSGAWVVKKGSQIRASARPQSRVQSPRPRDPLGVLHERLERTLRFHVAIASVKTPRSRSAMTCDRTSSSASRGIAGPRANSSRIWTVTSISRTVPSARGQAPNLAPGLPGVAALQPGPKDRHGLPEPPGGDPGLMHTAVIPCHGGGQVTFQRAGQAFQ